MPRDCVVHIVDDDETVRNSLAFLLSSSGYPSVIHASATTFLDALEIGEKACLVTDMRMPDMSGLDLLHHLRKQGHVIPVIIVTGHGDVALAVEAMKSGATDFIEKPYAPETLLAALARSADLVGSRMRDKAAQEEARNRIKMLSQRELEVLRGIVGGLPNKVVAQELGLSPRTVEVYRANLMAKMNAHNLADLVRMTMSMNLLQVQPEGRQSREP